MRILFSTIFAMALATTAWAEQEATTPTMPVFSGGIELEFTNNPTTDKVETDTTIDLGLDAGDIAFGGIKIKSTDGDTFELDEWMLGTEVGVATFSIGDMGGIFLEAESDYASLDNPTIKESVQISVDDFKVALGFSDLENDALDIERVQGAYTYNIEGLGSITGSGDYNLDSEQFMVGGRVATVMGAGGTITYAEATEKFNFEVDYTMNGAMVYLNGDEDDMTQNIGAGYSTDFNGLNLGADLNYNFDSEDVTPRVTVGFSF